VTSAGLGWGVGQLLNDLMDRKSDAINAPERAIVAGRLPVGPTLAFALLLGLALAVATWAVHPWAWVWAVIAAVLLVSYNAAKRIPVVGNVAHGALMAVASAIGASAVMPRDAYLGDSFGSFVRSSLAVWKTLVVVAGIAAWYLQSNYEKDRKGDRAAGDVTLATLLPVRASAALRAVGIVLLGCLSHAFHLLQGRASLASMASGVLLGIVSTMPALFRGTDEASLSGYRAAVASSILAMLALAAPVLGAVATALTMALALSLVRIAFAQSKNP
jgi:4-hydroxybenzoate polyprenyltransferase